MKSNESFQIIRTASSLEFVLRYGGVPNGEMVRRIAAAGRQVSYYAEDVIARFDHEPVEKELRIAAPLLSEWFDEPPTTDAIYAKAKSLGLVELHPSVGLHLAELYTEQPYNDWIMIGHKPIPLPTDGYPHVLGVDRDGYGRDLRGSRAHPGCTWLLVGRFAFGVPASQASVTQVP